MLNVPKRASQGNRAYAQKRFKHSYLPGTADNRQEYQVDCPTCKATSGKHCVAVIGADKGFWVMPHPNRLKVLKGSYEEPSRLSDCLAIECPKCPALKGQPCLVVRGSFVAESRATPHSERMAGYKKYESKKNLS